MATSVGKIDTPETHANVLASSAAVDDKKVEVELSGYMTVRIAKRLGLPEKEYTPGSKVKLHREDAAALIAEGGVAVDPTDNVKVAKILGL